MSSFDIAAIVSELRALLINAWVSNVYQVDSLFTIKFRTKEGTVELLIEPSKRLHLTKYQRPKPKFPSKFCMTLRKYLRNQRVLEIKQYKFDRVVVLEVGRVTAEGEEQIRHNKLIVEFFERGNLVLLDSEDKVIVALNYRVMRDRRIIPNRKFNFAPSRGMDIKQVELDDFKTIIQNSDQNLIRTIIRNLNISPIYAEEICFRAHIDKEMQVSNLIDENYSSLFENLKGLISLLQENTINPVINQVNSNTYLTPIDLAQFSSANKQIYKNFNAAADEFFSSKEEIKTVAVELKDKKTELSKTEKILKNQQKAIQQLERNSIRYKQLGDILYQNFQEIEELLTSIKNAHNNGRSWEEITNIFQEAKKKNIKPAQFVKKINYNNATLLLTIDGEEFSIDFRKSVAENANNFYTKAKKAAAKLKGAKKAYQQLFQQKDKVELEAKLIAKEDRKLIEKRKKPWYEKFHWFISSDNFLVIGGRDLKTNELIVRKYMDNNDIFFHATFQGAPVVVIKTEGKQVPEQTLKEAAKFAVTFSKAWKSNYGQADVYCVNASQVSLTPPSGEYLRKGSFIVRGKRNEFKNTPLELILGVKFDEKFAIIMAGPPTAIKKHNDLFVQVKFGDKSSAHLAKLIKNRFLKESSNEHQKRLVQNLPLDEIQRSFPGGKGELVE